MPAMERILDAIDGIRVDFKRIDIDGALVDLADVAHFEAPTRHDLGLGEPVIEKMLDAFGLDRLEQLISR